MEGYVMESKRAISDNSMKNSLKTFVVVVCVGTKNCALT